MTVPNFVVAGAGRSGTTGLVEGLRSHPDVFITKPKEPHYFALHGETVRFTGPGDDKTINRVAIPDRRAYLSLYPSEPHEFVALGDGSVSTLVYHQRAIPEILTVNPEMRIILILREPVARAYSAFLYMKARGFEPCKDFVSALKEESRRREEGWHHLWWYTEMSKYSEGVRAFQESFDQEQIGLWFYDDMTADYIRLVAEVAAFLGLSTRELLATERIQEVNVSGKPRSAPLQRGISMATRHEPLRLTVRRLTTFRFRERVRRTLLKPAAADDVARRALQGVFQADLKALRDLVPLSKQPNWLSSSA